MRAAGRTFHPPRHDRENPNQLPVPRGVLRELETDNALDIELYEWAAGRLDDEVRRYAKSTNVGSLRAPWRTTSE